mmetsp:Transcript_36878/g.66030  ORF Transcript_36878/g.66030 Transcript_36878/m.66030 type:complete len:129 (-) Transcript_36878:787-1173(-)
MSGRLVKQQLAAFLAAGSGGARKRTQQSQQQGKDGKGGKEASGKSHSTSKRFVLVSEASKKRRNARKRKDKKRALDVPRESVRERNLRLLEAGSKRNSEVEELLAKVTGVAGGGGAQEEESDFDDLDF